MLVRTQICLEEEQRKMLQTLSYLHGKSMAELIREALDAYRKSNQIKHEKKMKIVRKLAGAWANSPNWKNVDALKWQRELRHEKGI